MSSRKKKVRVDFKKNRGKKSRSTQQWREAIRSEQDEQLHDSERVSGKGNLSRRRTIITEETADGDLLATLDVDESSCLRGRVLSVVGSHQCRVQTDNGHVRVCAIRKVLRTMSHDARNAVVTGDVVLLTPSGEDQGMVQRVEPRHGSLGRDSRRSEHLIVVNVDVAIIVITAIKPHFKPSLVDRFLVSCEKGGVEPVICINKCDLIAVDDILPLVGNYANCGYSVLLTSAVSGYGIDMLRHKITGRQAVFSGQSGVGKSSLMNAIQPNLGLKTSHVSVESGKGRHTTRTAILQPLDQGGWVVDTPGIRQLRLWNVGPEEVEGYFREFRPYVRYCKFPDCRHDHELECGIKLAVSQGIISQHRYDSYLKILHDDEVE